MRIYMTMAFALTMAGCATVTRGTSDQITVTSEPSNAQVTTSLSQACTTPCTFTVGRKDEFTVKIAAPGYKAQEIPVTTRVAVAGAAGFVGNALIGGVVGMTADAVTGATLEHVPNPVNAVLEPVEHSGRPAHRSRPAPKPVAPEAASAAPTS
jgi:PEGA domain